MTILIHTNIKIIQLISVTVILKIILMFLYYIQVLKIITLIISEYIITLTIDSKILHFNVYLQLIISKPQLLLQIC